MNILISITFSYLTISFDYVPQMETFTRFFIYVINYFLKALYHFIASTIYVYVHIYIHIHTPISPQSYGH